MNDEETMWKTRVEQCNRVQSVENCQNTRCPKKNLRFTATVN